MWGPAFEAFLLWFSVIGGGSALTLYLTRAMWLRAWLMLVNQDRRELLELEEQRRQEEHRKKAEAELMDISADYADTSAPPQGLPPILNKPKDEQPNLLQNRSEETK